MKNILRLFVLGFALIVVMAPGSAIAQQGAPTAPPAPVPAPPAAQTFQGSLVDIDTDAHVIVAMGADNKEWKFTYTDQTEVVGPEKTIQGLAGKSGSTLKIMYRTERSTNLATRIEVMAEKK